MKLKTRKANRCRQCSSVDMTKQFSLGKLYVSDFINPDDHKELNKAPLTLVKCDNCSLVQLSHTAPQELMYTGNYWYKSGLNPVIVKDLKDIVDKIVDKIKISKGDIWLDIGANDGTLLSFVPNTFFTSAVEPAENLQAELEKKSDHVIPLMWENIVFKKKCKVITAIGMFYDTDRPNIFIRKVKHALADNGIFVAQLMTLAPMLRMNDVSNICHEHIEYYSYETLVNLFEDNGLEIFEVKKNSINGGSYRIFARHYRKGSSKRIKLGETWDRLDLERFWNEINVNKKKTVDFIKQVVADGRKVYGYGASTKGNTILQWYGLGPDQITGIADKNPDKWGKLTVGSNIPIVSEKEAREEADYLFVLPYAFLEEFMVREYKFRKRGGKFIVSIPVFQIL